MSPHPSFPHIQVRIRANYANYWLTLRRSLSLEYTIRGYQTPLRRQYWRNKLVDRVDQLFEATFQEIVESSHEEHELVLVGTPVGSTDKFICRGARFRRSVLVEGKNTADWLPAVLVITWRHGSHGPEPLLQMNSPQTSTREMGKISHVSGYINQQDQTVGPQVGRAASAESFELSPDTPLNALKRELASDFAIQSLLFAPTLVGTERFFYPDKENLFF